MVIENNNNNQNVNIPEHLSKEYFIKVLKNGLNLNKNSDNENENLDNNDNSNNNKSKIQINNIKYSMGSSGGDNYCSDIYRVLIEYQLLLNNTKNNNNNNNNEKNLQKISLIIKNMSHGKDHSEFIENMDFFNKEVQMLTVIMPKIEYLLNNSGMFAPKCFYTSKEPASRSIVLQDLKALGYELADRLEGLDEKHTKILLRKLGQYHAASMVLAKQNPELMKPFNKGFIQEANMQTNLFESIFIKNLKHITDMITHWENYGTIAEKLRKIEKDFRNRSAKCILPKTNDVRVLNHGDLWVNNFMFKYDQNNNPYDVVFLDLQISYYSGLGVDINYFLNTSVKLDLLKSKRYELLRHYYKSFKLTLEQLNYDKIPTWNDVKNEINDKEFFGFIAFEAILPLISMDREKSKNNNLETLADEKLSEEKREIMFSSNRMIETIKYALDRFDELGVLD